MIELVGDDVGQRPRQYRQAQCLAGRDPGLGRAAVIEVPGDATFVEDQEEIGACTRSTTSWTCLVSRSSGSIRQTTIRVVQELDLA